MYHTTGGAGGGDSGGGRDFGAALLTISEYEVIERVCDRAAAASVFTMAATSSDTGMSVISVVNIQGH